MKKLRKPKGIGFVGAGISKKHIPMILKDLRKQGYRKLKPIKTGDGYYSIMYDNRKKKVKK